MSTVRLAARLLSVVLAGVLLLGPGALPAHAQETATPTATSVPAEEEKFDPDMSEEPAGTQPEEATSEEPIDPEEATSPDEEQDEVSSETIQQAGWGSAADQTPEAKRAEAEAEEKAEVAPIRTRPAYSEAA